MTAHTPAPGFAETLQNAEIMALAVAVEQRAPSDGVTLLAERPDHQIGQVLSVINPSVALSVLLKFPEARRAAILAAAPTERRDQWTRNQAYPEGSVGRLMEAPLALFDQDATVGDAVAELRQFAKPTLVTYGYVVDREGALLGVLVMRDLLLADPGQPLRDIMVRDPFYLKPDQPILDVTQEVLHRHYPVYPVCDARKRLVGLVRGYVLFEEQAFEISAQPGLMVGVEEEERIATPWRTSLRFRHPWLQFNLLTAFLAAAVVGIFEETISQVVALAAFLPVLAGQSGNTGCQALAVTLRGMTLGELQQTKRLIVKETWLGLLNGAFVGITAGLGMLIYALLHHAQSPLRLGIVVFLAMVGSCVVSSVCGALVPLALKRYGADPATASSIFVTTATDIASMGMFLWLASAFVL
jgi:magnesium transporter